MEMRVWRRSRGRACRPRKLGLVDSLVEPDALNGAVNTWTRRLPRARSDGVAALKRHMAQNLRAIVLDGAADGWIVSVVRC